MEKGVINVNTPSNRKDALLKLLTVEPETMDNLVKETGWGHEVTSMRCYS